MTTTAHAFLDNGADVSRTVDDIERRLNENVGRHRVFVPVFGFHLESGLFIDFGKYRLQQLGELGFEREIIEPLRRIRGSLGEAQVANDIADVRESLKIFPNVPVMSIEYDGSRAGAVVIIRSISENISTFLQFIAAWVVRNREDVKVIDHRGAYFGRYSTFIPVLSLQADSEPIALGTPNLLGNPYGPTITSSDIDYLNTTGLLNLLPKVPVGPTKGDGVDAILLRAAQLIADGERAVSIRQAMIAYVGACDAMFGKSDASELYTCTGMAASLGDENFNDAFRQAKLLYEARSLAAHDGVAPESLGPARNYALACIKFLASRRSVLKNKSAIRRWLASYLKNTGRKST